MTAERSPGGSEGKAHSCAGVRKDGTPCAATVIGEQQYCWHHDPANEQARKTIASNAAKSKGKPPRIVQTQKRLENLVDKVEDGKLKPGTAAVMFTGLGVLIKAVEQERRLKETEELQQRLEELERIQQRRDSLRGI
jgi:hypothetical protein